jgi:long-chain-acyl-CoA dehydrogenase
MRAVMTEEHEAYRAQLRRFLEAEVAPNHETWAEQGFVPKEVWLKAGEMGFLCPMVPEGFGGPGCDFGFAAVVTEEVARLNLTGLGFTMHSEIVAPYITRFARDDKKQQWLPKMVGGELIGALGMTEPGTGSDVKSIKTRAIKDGDHYVINGQKTFITNGHNCGIIVLAVKTDPDAGRKGISLIAVEEGTPGFEKGRRLKKLGLPAQDTSELFFDDVRVPVENLLGEENQGFYYMMQELAQERLAIAVRSAASLEAMFDETVAYTQSREAFGNTLLEFQNTRFKLAEAKSYIEMLRAFVDDCLREHLQGGLSAERAAMAKLVGTELQGRFLDEMLQLHGGYGYMREYLVGRAWLDARVMRIYGGSSEVMKEIISRSFC